MEDDRFLTGVNYWPRQKAMYWWSRFDVGEVADGFDVIVSLRMDVERVFLLWDDWQETPEHVSPGPLGDLGIAATDPKVTEPTRRVTLDVTPDDYYRDPSGHARRLYEPFAG